MQKKNSSQSGAYLFYLILTRQWSSSVRKHCSQTRKPKCPCSNSDFGCDEAWWVHLWFLAVEFGRWWLILCMYQDRNNFPIPGWCSIIGGILEAGGVRIIWWGWSFVGKRNHLGEFVLFWVVLLRSSVYGECSFGWKFWYLVLVQGILCCRKL